MVHERILLDIETQRDFFEPGRSCYSPDASRAAQSIYRLFSWARIDHIPVISTVLRVRANEHGPLTSAPIALRARTAKRSSPRHCCATESTWDCVTSRTCRGTSSRSISK